MDRKANVKIKYLERPVNNEKYEAKVEAARKQWMKYYETHEDNFPNKKRKDSKSFAKWCIDSRNEALLVDWDLNNDLDPSQFGASSTKDVNIYCEGGHVYTTKAFSLFHGTRCPYCPGFKVLKGFNDLASIRPDLAEEWNYEKNDIGPDEITVGSQRKVWWKCKRGHEFQAHVYDRVVKNRPCFTCRDESLKLANNQDNNNRIQAFDSNLPYEERLRLTKEYWKTYFDTHEDTYPKQRYNSESFAKWCVTSNNVDLLVDWEKNNDFDPSKIGRSTRRKVTILCNKGQHLYDTMPNYITDGSRCPYCSGNKVLPGFNDLATKSPLIAAEWDYQKNDIKPSEVTYASKQYAWWKCPEGHSYKMMIPKRTINKHTCPYCNISAGESAIKDTLDRLGIEYVKEHFFEDRRMPDTDRKLKDDFAIMKQGKVAFTIEFHGRQHEAPVDFSGKNPQQAKKDFERIKQCDEYKTAYLKAHGIPQFIIWYHDLDKVPELVEDIVKKMDILKVS